MTITGSHLRLATPNSPQELDALRGILGDYAKELGIDLCFQGFAAELAGLPGDYAPPGGNLLTALVDGVIAGCCALRPLKSLAYPNACEMKRLFVRQAYRSAGVGHKLVEAMLDFASFAAYDYVLLDTLDDMKRARALYQEFGFEEIPPYYNNPIAGAHYLMAKLKPAISPWLAPAALQRR